jgi:hypothetical protein
MAFFQVDQKITLEFLKGDITSQAYKAYLRSVVERRPTELTPDQMLNSTVPFKEKAKVILDQYSTGAFRLSEWEVQFVEDNLEEDNPTPNQSARMDRLFRRFQR